MSIAVYRMPNSDEPPTPVQVNATEVWDGMCLAPEGVALCNQPYRSADGHRAVFVKPSAGRTAHFRVMRDD